MFCMSLTLLLATAPLTATIAPVHQAEQHKHQEIRTDQLKSWYDQNKSMVVIDARSKPYFDGTVLPNAKWMPAESSEKDLQAAIPEKNSLIVVYCAGPGCPASGWLYNKLSAMGYTNIYEYRGGLQDWIKRGFPTSQLAKSPG